MKTERYAEETNNYNTENKNRLEITYLTKIESDEMQEALERVAEATLQSGLRYMKTTLDQEEGREQVFLDAEDTSSSVVANIVSDLKELDHSFKFKGTRQSMDHVVIIFEDEKLVKEVERE